MELSKLIVSGGDWTPPRLVCYGDEKIGKTSFAARAPAPLFIGTDDGRRRLDVDGLPVPETWTEFVGQLEQVAADAPSLGYQSVVLDTLNGVADLASVYICDRDFGGRWNDPRNGFLAWGGSQGWAAVSEEFRRVLPLFDSLVDAGVWVIILAHSSTRSVKSPTDGEWMQFAPAVDRRVWARVGAWADVILRADFEASFVTDDNGRRRAVSDGTRVLRCASSPSEVAGCRVGYELPDSIPLSWDEVEAHLGKQDGSFVARLEAHVEAMSDDDVKKVETFLGVTRDGIHEADPTKVRQLLNRLDNRRDR